MRIENSKKRKEKQTTWNSINMIIEFQSNWISGQTEDSSSCLLWRIFSILSFHTNRKFNSTWKKKFHIFFLLVDELSRNIQKMLWFRENIEINFYHISLAWNEFGNQNVSMSIIMTVCQGFLYIFCCSFIIILWMKTHGGVINQNRPFRV